MSLGVKTRQTLCECITKIDIIDVFSDLKQSERTYGIYVELNVMRG